MPRAGFLAQLGMFVLPRFLDADHCARLRREMQTSPRDPARILTDDYEFSVVRDTRRTELAQVSPETRSLVTSLLMKTKPSLEQHFSVELAGCESPSFLVYQEGCYYSRHVDSNPFQDAPVRFRDRRVSISIFLNGEGREEDRDSYMGGSLTFYGSQRVESAPPPPRIAVTGEEGLLIGFESHWPHEVTPVQRGTRYSIVTWFA